MTRDTWPQSLFPQSHHQPVEASWWEYFLENTATSVLITTSDSPRTDINQIADNLYYSVECNLHQADYPSPRPDAFLPSYSFAEDLCIPLERLPIQIPIDRHAPSYVLDCVHSERPDLLLEFWMSFLESCCFGNQFTTLLMGEIVCNFLLFWKGSTNLYLCTSEGNVSLPDVEILAAILFVWLILII